MNNELKILNKKIKLLNEVIAMNNLFIKPKNHSEIFSQERATVQFSELIKKSTTGFSFISEQEVLSVAKRLRGMFGEKAVTIKRQILNDKLISVSLIQDENIMPINPDAFKSIIEKIKIK